MQQLTCPNCGTKIPAEKINIQELVAVCPTCDTIFKFTPSEANKTKRRKVKKPEHLQIEESPQGTRFTFRTNFRLDRSEAVVAGGSLALIFSIISIVLVNQALQGLKDVPIPLLALMIGFSLSLFYYLALEVYNKTVVTLEDEQIKVARQPLPNPLTQPSVLNLSGVESFIYEETPASIKEAYDTPRFHVWAVLADGSRRVLLKDLVEDYAIFISQELNERLELNHNADVSRLVDELGDEEELHHLQHESQAFKQSN